MSLFACLFWSTIILQHYVVLLYNIVIQYFYAFQSDCKATYDNNVIFLNVTNYRHLGEDSAYFNSWT